jgi:hypothetical protein
LLLFIFLLNLSHYLFHPLTSRTNKHPRSILHHSLVLPFLLVRSDSLSQTLVPLSEIFPAMHSLVLCNEEGDSLLLLCVGIYAVSYKAVTFTVIA